MLRRRGRNQVTRLPMSCKSFAANDTAVLPASNAICRKSMNEGTIFHKYMGELSLVSSCLAVEISFRIKKIKAVCCFSETVSLWSLELPYSGLIQLLLLEESKFIRSLFRRELVLALFVCLYSSHWHQTASLNKKNYICPARETKLLPPTFCADRQVKIFLGADQTVPLLPGITALPTAAQSVIKWMRNTRTELLKLFLSPSLKSQQITCLSWRCPFPRKYKHHTWLSEKRMQPHIWNLLVQASHLIKHFWLHFKK